MEKSKETQVLVYDYSLERIKRVIKKLDMPSHLAKSIKIFAEYCGANSIHPTDIILTRHYYAIIEERLGYTMPKLETDFRTFLDKLSKEQYSNIKDIFEYYRKPTPKKMLQLILSDALF